MRAALIVFGLALLPALSAPARAAESYDACKYEVTSLPAVLSSQGVWCLKGDLSTSLASGAAITIAANNVTLDCNRYKVGGLAAGLGTSAIGVEFTARTNVTVRQCNIRGFLWGLHGQDAANPTVENNIFEFNTVTGIYLRGGSGSIVRHNRVSDTGNSTLANTATFGIRVENDADIVDNLVSGIDPDTVTPNDPLYGIYTVSTEGTVTGNRIRGLRGNGVGSVYGIYNLSSTYLAIDHNYIDLDGDPNGTGIRCSGNLAMSTDNRLMGTTVPVLYCASTGDVTDPQ